MINNAESFHDFIKAVFSSSFEPDLAIRMLVFSGNVFRYNGDDNIPLLVPPFDVPVRFDNFFQRITFIDDRLQFSRLAEFFEGS